MKRQYGVRQLVPSLPRWYPGHPGLTIELQVSDALVDMSHDGIDIAIRTGSTQTGLFHARSAAMVAACMLVRPTSRNRASSKHP